MVNIKDDGNKPFAAIIITAIITTIILIGAFQVFWYEPIKGKCIKAESQVNEKEVIIFDLRILLEKERVGFSKFKMDSAWQFAELKKITDEYKEKASRLSSIIDDIYARWDLFEGNFCTDEKIVPYTLWWIRTAKAEAKI
jgi:hypothetical protein